MKLVKPIYNNTSSNTLKTERNKGTIINVTVLMKVTVLLNKKLI